MTDPYLDFIVEEAKRVEGDLASFRSRSLSVLTSSTAVVGLITAAITFGASKSEGDTGVSDNAIAVLAVGIGAFVVATMIALAINMAAKVRRPDADSLIALTGEPVWTADVDHHERYVANSLAQFIQDMHVAIDRSAQLLNAAIGTQIIGLMLVSVGGIIAAG